MTKTKQGLNSRVLILLLIFEIIACTNKNEGDKTTILRLRMYSIEFLPSDSTKIIDESQNGNHGKLLFANRDTVYFNFGYEIDNLAEKDPSVVYYPYDESSIRPYLDTTITNPENIVYTNKPNFDIDEFRKQNVYYEGVGGYRAKLSVPRDIKKGGITGVYIDSLQKQEGGRLKFNFFVKNADSLQSLHFLKVIKTIRFNL